MKIAVCASLVVFLATTANAADRYVRADATGSGSGADWANAYPELPPALVRGDVYYVADGSYTGYEFDDAEAGGVTTTIKKATVLDHGTSTGWDDTFGDGQAVFTGEWAFRTSSWIVDGQTRNEADWFDGDAYGFAISNGQDQQVVIQNYGDIPDDVTIRYVFLDAIVGNLPDVTIRRVAVDVDDYDGGSVATGLVFHRMYVRGSGNVWFIRTTDGALIEYCASEEAASNSANHGEVVNAYFSTFNATVRYNIFRNEFIGSGGTALIAVAAARDQEEKPQLDIYGNVFYNYHVGDGAIGFLGNEANGGSCTNCRVYNNTFANSNNSLAVQFPDGSGNEVRNNIFVNLGDGEAGCDIGVLGTITDNAVGSARDGGGCGGTNAQLGLSTAIFVDYDANNFRLGNPTDPGSPLAGEYGADPRGVTRGADGVWDRGAFEFGSGGAPPAAPSDLSVD